MKKALGLCVVGTGAILSAKEGTVITNIIQSARVDALCCSHAPFLMKKAGIVHEKRRIRPQ